MDKTYDFALIYEVKNRELDSVLLLKCELEKRGYSVALIETWEQECHRDRPVKAKVAVCYSLYNDETINYVNQFLVGCRKFVNLQWEQVRTNGTDQADKDAKISSGIYGLATKAVHVCWGNHNYRKLTEKYDVPKDHAVVTGNISLDFLREEFAGFYLTRDELCREYKLQSSNKIYLFISSFSYIDLPESILNSSLYQNQGFDVKAHYDISKSSRETILDWFEKELSKHPDLIIIYRPHPAEANSSRLKLLTEHYSNFRVISDLSIKQWILTSDKIYIWWSTSIAEVLAANKGCSILRPLSIPYENELTVYNGATVISTYDEFDLTLFHPTGFPLSKRNFDDVYYIDDEPSFIKVCNLLENVITNDEFIIDDLVDQNLTILQTYKLNFRNKIKDFLLNNRICYSIAQKILCSRVLRNGKTLEGLKKEYLYTVEMRNKNRSTNEEIKYKENQLIEIIETCSTKYGFTHPHRIINQ